MSWRWLASIGSLLLLLSPSLLACSLNMGYRTSARPPLIATAPNNAGLYQDLYRRAAELIGCELKIVRLPKLRVLIQLQNGTIDFYPGFSFTQPRSEYAFFLENGLPGDEVGLSRAELETITSLKQLHGKTLLRALGGPNYVANDPNIKVVEIAEMSLDQAAEMLALKRADFFIYNSDTIQQILNTYSSFPLKVHPDCCGGLQPMYLGFSRQSPHYGEEVNERFDPSKPQTPDNFPFRLKPDSLAAKFANALKQMQQTGETSRLYARHHKINRDVTQPVEVGN